MINMKWLITILFLLQLPSKTGDDLAPQSIKDGNRLYHAGKIAEAEKAFDAAVNSEHKYTALFNKGNAQYRQKKFSEAIKTYTQVSSANTNNNMMLRSAAYYNTGVVYSSQQKLEESIEAYKNALRLNWHDTKARENLQKALMELKKQSGGGGGGGENKEPSQQPSKSNISQSQARQQLERLEEKERASQQKITEKRGQYGGNAGKDW